MGIHYKFVDNAVYSAEDVKDTFQCLTVDGTDIFTNTGNVLEDLNNAVNTFSSAGVETFLPDACAVVKQDNIYKISSGTVFLQNGMTVTVDDSGQEIVIPQNTACHVYVTEAENGPFVVSVNTVPEGAVPLADINVEGEILDTRVFAEAKMADTGGNSYFIMKNVSINMNVDIETLLKTVTLPTDKFNFVQYYSTVYQLIEGEKTEYENHIAFLKRGNLLDIYVEPGVSVTRTSDLMFL